MAFIISSSLLVVNRDNMVRGYKNQPDRKTTNHIEPEDLEKALQVPNWKGTVSVNESSPKHLTFKNQLCKDLIKMSQVQLKTRKKKKGKTEKKYFPLLLKQTLDLLYSSLEKIILSSFRKIGIHPLNMNKVLNPFQPSDAIWNHV